MDTDESWTWASGCENPEAGPGWTLLGPDQVPTVPHEKANHGGTMSHVMSHTMGHAMSHAVHDSWHDPWYETQWHTGKPG